jgi:hypothetical protein
MFELKTAHEAGKARLWKTCEKLIELGFQVFFVGSYREWRTLGGNAPLFPEDFSGVPRDLSLPYLLGKTGNRFYFQPPQGE